MIKILNKQQLLEDKSINKTEFENQWYFSLDDVSKYLEEDLSEVESIELPLLIDGKRKTVKCGIFENIEKGRKRESLSNFNKKLLQAKDFKLKKK